MTTSPAELLRDALSEIYARRTTILNELNEIDVSLKRYGIDPLRLKGPVRSSPVSPNRPMPEPVVLASMPALRRRGRRPAPPMDWLASQLKEGDRSQSELLDKVVEGGYSETAALQILKRHTFQFRAERAPRQAGKKGVPPMIWSLRG